MTDEPDPLELALQRAVRHLDPVPEAVVEAARAAFTWRTIDEELAALAFDSATDAELAGVRSTGGARALTFEAGDVVIDVEVRADAGVRTVLGQVVGPEGAAPALELQTPARSVALPVDELGRFLRAAVPAGPVRLRCTFAPSQSLRPVTTEWVVI